MKRLFLFYLCLQALLSNFVSATESHCGVINLKQGSEVIDMYFEIPVKNQQVKLLFKIADQKKTEIQDLFYCILKKESINCIGDDDGGNFTLYPKESAISITRIGSGNPDQKRIELKPIPKTPYKTSDCKDLRQTIKE